MVPLDPLDTWAHRPCEHAVRQALRTLDNTYMMDHGGSTMVVLRVETQMDPMGWSRLPIHP